MLLPALMQRLPLTCLLCAVLLAGCSSAPKRNIVRDSVPTETSLSISEELPDAVPRIEPISQSNLRPYEVLGYRYTPIADNRGFWQEGVASWYGRKFHGQPTANGETYDMYEMTAAHPTLPLPSYARVTRKATGKSIIVRINDRGPFHADRIIDLSYAAAFKLGIVQQGSDIVIVQAISANEIRDGSWSRPTNAPLTASAPPPAAAISPPPVTTVAAAPPAPPAPSPVTSTPNALRLANAPTPAPPVTASRQTTPPTRVQTRGIFLQFGAFSAVENATKLARRLEQSLQGVEPERTQIRRNDRGLQRVLLGPYPTRVAATLAAQRIKQRIGLDSVVLRQ